MTAMKSQEKRDDIVLAAKETFLDAGYSEASMDAIAKAAQVSVKTIYSHFKNKAALFNAVIDAICVDHIFRPDMHTEVVLCERFPWFSNTSKGGLVEAGKQYLHHLLKEEQLALYRIITRDGARFPELGVLYQENIGRGRTGILTAYIERTARLKGWAKRDLRDSVQIYEALLRGEIFESALHGLQAVSSDSIEKRARMAADVLWSLVNKPKPS